MFFKVLFISPHLFQQFSRDLIIASYLLYKPLILCGVSIYMATVQCNLIITYLVLYVAM